MTTQTRIADERRQYENAGYSTFVVEHEGERFTCFVLPLAMCPALPDFARQAVSDDRSNISCPDDASVFGVCETIPEEFRRFVALHEILEYWIGGCCGAVALLEAKALMDSAIAPPRQIDYLRMRRNFFNLLVPYAIEHRYAAHKIEEFQASLKVFERLAPA